MYLLWSELTAKLRQSYSEEDEKEKGKKEEEKERKPIC